MAKNYFCQLPLKRRGDERPPLVFGRVKTIYPSDGYIQNIEEMEMYFPHIGAEPDVLHIRNYDLAPQKPIQSYCVGVKFYVSEEELGDFSQSENIFLEKGFAPLYETGYLDLLDVNEQNHASLPWLHVIGSGWFASVPDTVQQEIREQLRKLVHWGNVIFNYHPRRYALRYLSLNDELEFNYGFSEHYLVAPQNTDQAFRKVEERFGEIFMQGTGCFLPQRIRRVTNVLSTEPRISLGKSAVHCKESNISGRWDYSATTRVIDSVSILLGNRSQSSHDFIHQCHIPFATQDQILVSQGSNQEDNLRIRRLDGKAHGGQPQFQHQWHLFQNSESGRLPGGLLVGSICGEVVLRVPLIHCRIDARRAFRNCGGVRQLRRGQELHLCRA